MKVLLAEDDAVSRLTLEKHLQSWGYEVLSAEDGQKAWDILHSSKPQILLVDWIMPGLNGLELCKKIRTAPHSRYTYIIFLTSRIQNADIVTALDAGADDYICKPFDRAVLKSRMAVGVRTINYENQLRQSESRYQRITSSITDYIFNVSLYDGKIVSLAHTDASIAVTGYSAAQLTDNPNLWLEMTHRDDRELLQKQLDNCLAGKKVAPVEYRIIRKDGVLRWVRSTIVQYFDKAGRITSYDCLLQDITEKKQAENEITLARHKAEEAQLKAERLNLQLEITYKKLMETSHSAGMAEVAADVLHNVGNALNSINVSAESVKEILSDCEVNNLLKLANLLNTHRADLAEFLTNDIQGRHIPAYLNEVSEHLAAKHSQTSEKVDAIIRHVEQVKDIVKTQQSYTGIGRHQDYTNINEIIESAIEINHSGLQRNNIEVIRQYDDIGSIMLDRQRCLQVLVNLIDNAEYSLSKSTIEPKLLKIITKKVSSDKFVIEVQDNGIGIAEQSLSKIFDRGYSTKKDSGGFGLHSCLTTVNDMQGNILAGSQGVGKGATFRLELPLTKTEVKNGKHKNS